MILVIQAGDGSGWAHHVALSDGGIVRASAAVVQHGVRPPAASQRRRRAAGRVGLAYVAEQQPHFCPVQRASSQAPGPRRRRLELLHVGQALPQVDRLRVHGAHDEHRGRRHRSGAQRSLAGCVRGSSRGLGS